MTNTKRAEYMSGNLTHDEYYGILVEFLDENRLRSMLPGNRTPEQWRELFEEDQHLNNVPLKQWDFLDWRVRQLPTGKTKEDLKAITGVGGWSISDSVCVLKCAARRYAGVTLTPRKINR